MTEYTYKLTLPSIESIMIPGKFQELFPDANSSKNIEEMRFINPKTYLLPENLKIGHYDLDHSVLFHKINGRAGVVHTDTNGTWAINYIVGGTGILKYYDPEQLGPPKPKVDPTGIVRPIWEHTKVPPIKEYFMEPGVYLISTEMPHLAIGYENRYALSIRVPYDQQKSWQSAVEFFKPFFDSCQ